MFSCMCRKKGSFTLQHPKQSPKLVQPNVQQNGEVESALSKGNSNAKSDAVQNASKDDSKTSTDASDDKDAKEKDKEEIGNVKRRSGFTGHAKNTDKDADALQIIKHAKNQREEKSIKEALHNNEFLRNLLEGKRLQAVVDAMYLRCIKAGEIIIQEGTVGTQMFVSAEGTYEITIKNAFICTFDNNRVFGELALLYDAKRQASVTALTVGKVWVLDQIVYQQLTIKSEIEYHEQLLNFLKNVPKLNSVPEQTMHKVVDLLKKEFFETGSTIVRQGEKGDKFYIISAGSVTITKNGEGVVGKMIRGEFFGQLALLKEDARQATVIADPPGVECCTLSRSEFIEHFGQVEDIGSITTATLKRTSQPIENPFENIALSDLKIVSTLGVGGFGRVELVQHKKEETLTFALKYLKKIDMMQQQQQDHAYNEKNIQISCDSIFIVRMYKTFRDNKYIFFLMESCLGGDLWSLLQKQKNRKFDENTTKFYAACVIEAFAYLHERNIVYRDLKPENLLLDTSGYLKITDFGFAKKLGTQGKTYTFAGTPEYIAPEIILNRGHNQAVDYWALGNFVFEMLVGKTPFRSNDTSYMTTYNLILRGIEEVDFPGNVPRKAENLIKKLCKSVPTERLGCQKNGVQAIRDHKWFIGFDWRQLNSRQLEVPIKRPVKSNIDTQYFDNYEKDTDIPPDELSGWDNNF